MTHRLFFHDDELTAEVEVLSCEACAEQFAVTLAATPFHPQGGGQPFDTGSIGTARVLRVLQEPGRIVHYLDSAVPLGRARASVDGERRTLHARLHSAGHLIGHYGESQGWEPQKAHHWPGESRVSFTRGALAQAFTVEEIQTVLTTWITDDLPRHVQLDGDQRSVGFGGQTVYPCGGTHVRSTAAIGPVEVLSVKEKKGVLSISYHVI